MEVLVRKTMEEISVLGGYLTCVGCAGIFNGMTPLLPTLGGPGVGWLMLGLKIAAAIGFIAMANMVMLYAC